MGKKEDRVRDGVLDHLEVVGEAVATLDEATRAYLDDDPDLLEVAQRVDDLESEADTIRRDTERVLFEGAFLPSHREDYFLLLERLDEVADKAEDAAKAVVLTRPKIPDPLEGDILAMLEQTIEMSARLETTVRALFEDTGRIASLVGDLKTFEEEIDQAEFEIVEALFASDLETADKILVKDLVEMLARVSDMIEDVGDHIAILLVKRQA